MWTGLTGTDLMNAVRDHSFYGVEAGQHWSIYAVYGLLIQDVWSSGRLIKRHSNKEMNVRHCETYEIRPLPNVFGSTKCFYKQATYNVYADFMTSLFACFLDYTL